MSRNHSFRETEALRIVPIMPTLFSVRTKFMADTYSDTASSNPDPSRRRSPNHVTPSETSDLFNVFPDCLIMWDDISGAKKSEFPSSVSSTEAEAIEPPLSSDQIKPPKSDQQSIQYHVHYHPLNGNKILGAFLAGAVLVFLGALFFQTKPSPQHPPGQLEPSERTQSDS
ncbi:MAG: hypothetical protein AAFQ57_04285 [Cyanobacteria bacterium J06626_14]